MLLLLSVYSISSRHDLSPWWMGSHFWQNAILKPFKSPFAFGFDSFAKTVNLGGFLNDDLGKTNIVGLSGFLGKSS